MILLISNVNLMAISQTQNEESKDERKSEAWLSIK